MLAMLGMLGIVCRVDRLDVFGRGISRCLLLKRIFRNVCWKLGAIGYHLDIVVVVIVVVVVVVVVVATAPPEANASAIAAGDRMRSTCITKDTIGA